MKGKLVISLDFEKYWGMRDYKSLKDCQENLEKVDKICSTLLDIFKQYDIHATWATVGFLSFRPVLLFLGSIPLFCVLLQSR